LIVQPSDGDAGWRARGRQNGMTRMQPGITHGANNRQSFLDSLLDRLCQRVMQVRLLVVAAGRDIDDANPVLFAMSHHPFQSALYVFLKNATRFSQFDEHDL
jgi:hypothetical protein